jgi:SP family arabinose:H+ symporter-like MFS transporter
MAAELDVSGGAGRGSGLTYVILIALVATLGGLLFGYDTAVIAGAVGYLKEHFKLGAGMTGWAASSALVGCMVGAAFAGMLGDRFGRKRMLILAGVLFTVSAIGSAVPRTLTEFVWARFIGGVGVGAASMLSPLYIAEISPARVRGRLVSMNQMAIVSGILLVYFVNMLIQRMGDHSWNVTLGWRWMFGSETLPAVLFAGLMCLVPKSPRWLMKQGRRSEALAVLERIEGTERAEGQIDEIGKAIAEEGGSIRELFRPGLRIALVIGVLLAIFQQVTGINAVLYYAPEIFKATGTQVDIAFIQTVSVGSVNFLFTIVAIWLIDKAGRKALLLVGSAVQCGALAMVGHAYYTQTKGPWVLVFILLYVGAFAVSMGPVVWVVIAEIFPTRIRGRAMSIATVTLWAACYLVSQTFPMLVERLGSATTFWTYGAMSALCFVFVWVVVPETKGKTLEEIERSWVKS